MTAAHGAEGSDVRTLQLGRALRRARERAGISVREMGRMLGCSPSHVSQFERGLTSPSVNTLFHMVRRLGMSLDTLFSESLDASGGAVDAPSRRSEVGEGRADSLIVRDAGRHRIPLSGGVTWELLMPAVETDFEFVEYVYEVGGSDGDDFLRFDAREYGVVLEGKLGGAIGFENFELEPGDSIAFDAHSPHRFWNAGDVVTRVAWVTRSGPSAGRVGPQGDGKELSTGAETSVTS